MGYDVFIVDYDLNLNLAEEDKVFRKLKNGNLKLSDFWVIDGDKIEPVETYFRWGDWFEEDLKKMAKMGTTGFIEIRGEMGEHNKYVFRGEKIEVYVAEVVYSSKPYEILE
ncbi:MAG: hypothetical protein QW835_06915 [Candidatus Hadarchaeum sp.]|uniref:hypothetical protein n=1 Tax=Candidatus Hadarchaeum sp. TaxID=2883567 RepID=UPI00317231F1